MTDRDDGDTPTPRHAELTSRPSTPELEGGPPMPEEITGRASKTDEDLTTLFANDGADHMEDGFKGRSNGDVGVQIPNGPDEDSSDDEDVTVG